MIRRGDQYDVHVFAIQHAPKIFHRVGTFAFFFFADGKPLGGHGVVEIGDDDALHFGVFEEAIEVALAHAAATDDTKSDFTVRSGFARAHGADERPGKRRTPRKQSSVADKLTAREQTHRRFHDANDKPEMRRVQE